MQPELIETFLDLIDTRSFNKTAERLGITQSTVSARVASLEKHVGRKLFTRSRAGTSLTTAGLSFEPHARDLQQSWTVALRAVQDAGNTALTMRIGLQSDLAGFKIGHWVKRFHSLLPDASLYIELDYSTQMCSDLVKGTLDLAVVFTPRPLPDLHFETLGEVRYVLVSSDVSACADIDPKRYVRADFSAAFHKRHAQLLPHLQNAPLSCGQTAAMIGLLTALGGTGYVLEAEAGRLTDSTGFTRVTDAPVITQSVYCAAHHRTRHALPTRRLITTLRDQLATH